LPKRGEAKFCPEAATQIEVLISCNSDNNLKAKMRLEALHLRKPAAL
jgi:hypothetical protein